MGLREQWEGLKSRLWGRRKAIDQLSGESEAVAEPDAMDLRPEAEKRAEQDAKASLGGEDEQIAQDLIELVARAPLKVYDPDDANEVQREIRAIGEKLCGDGGSERMLRIAYRVQALGYPDARVRKLEVNWNEICGWRW